MAGSDTQEDVGWQDGSVERRLGIQDFGRRLGSDHLFDLNYEQRLCGGDLFQNVSNMLESIEVSMNALDATKKYRLQLKLTVDE